MSIEIKRSVKPVEYNDAMELLEKRVDKLINKNGNELIWFLEHKLIYTAGKSYNKEDIIDKNIKVVKTSRGGKITCHSRGQIVCYLVLDLSKRNKDIRKFVISLENSIVDTLKEFKITSQSDRKNIGIWVNNDNELKKIAAIGIKVKRWVAYHGFSINIDNDLDYFQKIIPCGIKDKKIIKLNQLVNVSKKTFLKVLEKNLLKNLSPLNYS